MENGDLFCGIFNIGLDPIDNLELVCDFNAKTFKKINGKMSENNADNILITLSRLFELNYNCSYAVMEEKNYVDLEK